MQAWTGVRLRDLAALAGVPAPASAVVRSLEQGRLRAGDAHRRGRCCIPDALLALAVNGAPLAPDHGYPARVIVPALPGRAQHEVGPLDRVPERLMRLLSALRGRSGPPGRLLLAFAVAGYAASIVAGDPLWPWMAVWFVAVVVVHDGLLSPLAAVADAVLRFALRWFPRRPARPTTVNYVRVPALGAALTFLMFWPGIVRQGEPVVRGQTGLDQGPFLGPVAAAGRRDGRGLRAGLRGAAAHQTVSSRWLTASASPACAANHAPRAGQQRARHHQPHRER